ncbi:ABC transporter ATP-binding protein [Metabacillus fastidiosus]|nr:ABC transporter ATP-binding protein [Metabacillus fastidiosus]
MKINTEIQQLTKEFKSFRALNCIDLTINQGEFLAVLGPSGCGKTTFLRLLAGFDSPTSGKIIMGDKEIASNKRILPPEKRNIGMVFQSFALWPHMNVREHIRFPLLHHRFLSKKLKESTDERINEVLKIVDLTHLQKRVPGELSGGQRQRVALARAIAAEPSLLLMDEPLSNLDAELRVEMRREIQNLHRLTGATIVYVTHDQGEALAMADRIVVMRNGEIEQADTPAEIYCKPKTEFVATFVGKANVLSGKWQGNVFMMNINGTLVTWQNSEVSDEMKKKNLFPVRPEQLEISLTGQGIPAEIINVQYQGKEIHYTVRVEQQHWNIHESQLFKIGDKVKINLKEEANIAVSLETYEYI